MILEYGMKINIIIAMVSEFLLVFLVSWFICKKFKKKFYKVVIIIWLSIFFINCIAVIFNIPLIIGFNIASRFDGGINGKYISLGYAISVEGHNLIEESKYDIHFTRIFN